MNISFCSGNKILYNTPHLQLKSAKSPDNNDWFYAHRPNAQDGVIIAPIIHNKDGDSVVFIETQRPPLYAEKKAKSCIELPAGLVGDIDKNETAEEAVKKELLEETGYKADKISIQTRKLASSPGCVSETATVAIVDINEDKIVQTPVTDGGIITGIHKVPLKEVNGWLKEQEAKGKAISSHALSGLYYVFSNLAKSKNNQPVD